MANLIRSRSWGQVKPPPGARVDASHPLVQGMTGCWLFNEGIGGSWSLIAGEYMKSQVVGTYGDRGGVTGLYFSGTATNTGAAYVTPTGSRLIPSTQASLMWRGAVLNDGSLAFQPRFLGLDANATGADPFSTIGLLRPTTTQVSVIYATGGAGTSSINPVTLTYPYFVPITFICTWDSGVGWNLFYQGHVVLSGALGAVSLGNSGNGQLQVNSQGPANAGYNAGIITSEAYWWNRTLTLDEALWLSLEPYAFIVPPGPKVFYQGFGTSGATPVNYVPTIRSSPIPSSLLPSTNFVALQAGNQPPATSFAAQIVGQSIPTSPFASFNYYANNPRALPPGVPISITFLGVSGVAFPPLPQSDVNIGPFQPPPPTVPTLAFFTQQNFIQFPLAVQRQIFVALQPGNPPIVATSLPIWNTAMSTESGTLGWPKNIIDTQNSP